MNSLIAFSILTIIIYCIAIGITMEDKNCENKGKISITFLLLVAWGIYSVIANWG